MCLEFGSVELMRLLSIFTIQIPGEKMDVFWRVVSEGALVSILAYLCSLLISERLKISLQKENQEFLESLRWDLKTREQAVKVAEYLSLAHRLSEHDSQDMYLKVNQLGWELAMWLPDDIYRSMRTAIVAQNDQTNVLSVVVDVRRLLLGTKAGNLTQNDIMFHAPGIGAKK